MQLTIEFLIYFQKSLARPSKVLTVSHKNFVSTVWDADISSAVLPV